MLYVFPVIVNLPEHLEFVEAEDAGYLDYVVSVVVDHADEAP
jgi:hypothetical protein